MRYLIGLLVTIGLLFLLIVIIMQHDSGKPKTPASQKPLASYSVTNAVARLTTSGPITAEQTHEQIQISVDQDDVQIQTMVGYNGQVTHLQSFTNSEASYYSFLRALDKAGFTNGDTSPELKNEVGYCPLGNTYVFELLQNGKTLQRFWTNSCGKPKSYLGATDLTITLFHNQVPDYNNLANAYDVTL